MLLVVETMSDPIADMLTQIRNAQAVFKEMVDLPFSEINYRLAKILEFEGFVEKVLRRGRKPKKIIRIFLKYSKPTDETENDKKKGAISGLRRISRPGQRIYLGARGIKAVRGGFGVGIISTSKGIMTSKEARKKKLGGEVICEVW